MFTIRFEDLFMCVTGWKQWLLIASLIIVIIVIVTLLVTV